MKRIAHDGSCLLWSAVVLAGSVVSAGCSSSHSSSGADGGADGDAPLCGAAPCGGTCTSGRCFVTLSTSPNLELLAYDFVLGQTGVYWLGTYGPGGNVVGVPTAGGAAITLDSSDDQFTGVAVDAAYVYWSAGVSVDGGYIARATASGGQPTKIASGLNPPVALATDGTNVYWSPFYCSGGTCPILSMPVAGGTPVTLASLASNAGGAVRIFPTRGQVYWTTSDGRVLTVPASGGTPRQLAYEATTGVDVVADSAAAYWTNTAGNVMRLPLDGGAATLLASGQAPIAALAIDETSIYWISGPSNDPATPKAVMKVPLDGGTLTTIASPDGGGFDGVAVDDTSLYLLLEVAQPTSGVEVAHSTSVVKVTPK